MTRELRRSYDHLSRLLWSGVYHAPRSRASDLADLAALHVAGLRFRKRMIPRYIVANARIERGAPMPRESVEHQTMKHAARLWLNSYRIDAACEVELDCGTVDVFGPDASLAIECGDTSAKRALDVLHLGLEFAVVPFPNLPLEEWEELPIYMAQMTGRAPEVMKRLAARDEEAMRKAAAALDFSTLTV
jgi:hypothetical protein